MRAATKEAKQLGARLRQYRRGRGWTQEKLADLTELSVTQVSDLERGLSLHPKNLLKIRTFIGDNHA